MHDLLHLETKSTCLGHFIAEITNHILCFPSNNARWNIYPTKVFELVMDSNPLDCMLLRVAKRTCSFHVHLLEPSSAVHFMFEESTS